MSNETTMKRADIVELAALIGQKIAEQNQANFQIWPTLTLEQTAEALGISQDTVRKLLDENSIPYTRVGKFYRIKPGDINAYLERNYVPRKAE